MKKVAICTLGCKVNAYDSAYMQSLFEKNGYHTVPFGQPADIVVVNTCTVTAVADKKSRGLIRRAARTGRVIVAGCLAQRAAEQVLAIEGVSAVIGTDERGRIVDVAERLLAGDDGMNLTHALTGCEYEPMRVSTTGARTRGVLKIQEGCDCFCSYCIIPYVRGRSRSRALDDIMEEAQSLVQDGVRELVLTGIHVASYRDGNRGLGELLTALDGLGVRLRLGSLEPGMLDGKFVRQAARAQHLCPHFHLSLQSGSATVLQRMRRPYTPDEYMDFVTLLRDSFDTPAITTDVIAGFPAETEEEHTQTLRFIEKAEFARMHVFPFSAREGTLAYKMTPRVPKAVAKRRAAELIRLGDALETGYLQSLVGRAESVLFEEPSQVFDGCMEGYGARYVRVAAKAEKNEIRTVTLQTLRGKTVLGE